MTSTYSGMAVGLAENSRLAGYVIERQIGAGGMAAVYRAYDQRLRRPVALKVMSVAAAADEGFRRRFILESQAAAAVDDPHIIPVYEAGEADGTLFIAMRYVAGGDAHSLVQRAGPLPASRAMAIISPVAEALDAAHAAGLVHRDVKPANMLLDVRPGRSDHVYLSDFGISKAALAARELTSSGQFFGTPDYTAPEQMEGKPTDGRADQYALACAAFELLTGAPPFARDQVTAVILAQMSEPPPSLASRRPGLPAEADLVLSRALAKRPEDRYQTCREFAAALGAALAALSVQSGSAPVAPAGATGTAEASAGSGLETRGPDPAAEAPDVPRNSAVVAHRRDHRGQRRRRGALAAAAAAIVLAVGGAATAVLVVHDHGTRTHHVRTGQGRVAGGAAAIGRGSRHSASSPAMSSRSSATPSRVPTGGTTGPHTTSPSPGQPPAGTVSAPSSVELINSDTSSGYSASFTITAVSAGVTYAVSEPSAEHADYSISITNASGTLAAAGDEATVKVRVILIDDVEDPYVTLSPGGGTVTFTFPGTPVKGSSCPPTPAQCP